MTHRARFIFALAAFAVAGCAHQPAASPATAPLAPATTTTSAPAADPKSFLTLDEIPPKLSLPAPRVLSTQPSDLPPVAAIDLYAQARGAALDGERFTEINFLEKAIALDPDSYELYFELGKAYIAGNGNTEKAVEAFQNAAAVKPDDLVIHALLGRQFLAAADLPKAIEQLRLAMLTTEYRTRDDQAAAIDFFLGRALQADGYDRAALDRYDSLLGRLQDPTAVLRANPDVGYLVDRPEALYVQIGDLYAKHGQWPQAIDAYRPAADQDPANFEIQAKVVRALAAAGRKDESIRRAADVVMRFRASSDSVNLLRDACRASGRDDAAALDELRKLYAQQPDRALLFALADNLESAGRPTEAEALYSDAVKKDPSDLDVVKALFESYNRRNAPEPATKLLISELAARPQSLRELAPLWEELLRPARRDALHITTLQHLDVPPSDVSAKLYLVSRLANIWRRDILARTSLEQSVRQVPPFPPAYRELVGDFWQRPDWDDAQKIAACNDLSAAALKGGDASLAREVNGISLLEQKQPAKAADEFSEAIKLATTPSPDLFLTYAAALQMQGNDGRAEQTLWKVVSDHPADQDAWISLFRYYLGRNSSDQALKVLNQWLSADPGSVEARVLQSTVFAQMNNIQAAQDLLQKLFEDHGDNPLVVSSLFALDRDNGKIDDFLAKLEDRHNRHPDDRNVVEWLVEIYAGQKRFAEASRVLDATRQALSKDADSLYTIAHLYDQIDQKQTSQDVLQQVLQLDPANPPASNDLGYAWADQGKNLDQAEALIRIAVAAEPDNQSFLDSLGWVLYKRAKFTESRKYMELAIGPAALPDPVVLDHYGDVLYRLGDTASAAKQWHRSLDRLGQENAERDDLKSLRIELLAKLKQSDDHQPVNVAPSTEATLAPVRAEK